MMKGKVASASSRDRLAMTIDQLFAEIERLRRGVAELERQLAEAINQMNLATAGWQETTSELKKAHARIRKLEQR